MSHLDEGTLHALLDGELELHEVREIQAHLGTCSACDSRLRAAKDISGEADRLVASVQFPGSLRSGTAAVDEVEDVPPAEQPALPPRRERRIEARPVTDDAIPQVVLLPEENNWPERRRRWMAGARWAALLFVAVGAGYLASEARKSSPSTGSAFPARAAETDSPSWIVSPEETSGPDTAATVAPRTDKDPEPPRRQAQESRQLQESREVQESRKPAAAPPPAPAPEPESEPEPPPQAESETLAADTPLVSNAGNDESAPDEENVPRVTRADVKAEAAQALAELDLQRRKERAAAATAAIDRARRDSILAASRAPAAAAPAPRTLEQRSGIYLRIGLDEAARQLGRPVHVIEGLNAQFMGLVQGRQSPGADPARPVVRVVYQDSQGRMMLLDQQRIRPGQDWPSGATQWTVGEIGLVLHGEAGSEVLRNLRPRVR